jgi:hypothetical protein
MAVTTSAVAGLLRSGAVPMVRRMPRSTALTPSALVGGSSPARWLVAMGDGGGSAADGCGLAAGLGRIREVGGDEARMRRQRRGTAGVAPGGKSRSNPGRTPCGWPPTPH